MSAEVEGIGQQFAPTMMQMGIDPKGIVGHLTLVPPIFAGGRCIFVTYFLMNFSSVLGMVLSGM